jgi:membrane protease YdiL (CAAX protease family)
VIDVRRIGWRWLAIILLLYPALYVATGVLYSLAGGDLPSLESLAASLFNPGLMLQLLLANLIVSGLFEELGWRGYALDRLQERHTALVATLILGSVHAVWHIPLFFIAGITQGEMGLVSWDALIFLVGVPAGAIITTWVYNNTRRSILSAILLHCLFNMGMDLTAGLQGALPTGFLAILVGLIIVVDLGVVAIWGARTLTRRSGRAPHAAATGQQAAPGGTT